MKTVYRLHGDNIIECEVATSVILESIQYSTGKTYSITLIESSSITPAFEIVFEDGLEFIFEFFPGHNRWDVSLHDYLSHIGASLRESVDAFVTRLEDDAEVPVAAFEFCNALPAGNNAWQRAGRALAMTSAQIPYFYFAEIGGQELDSSRSIKAPRFPNPIVPFSYLSISSAVPDRCTTVYMPSRSISKKTYEEFSDAFASNDHKNAISALFTGTQVTEESLKSSRIKSAEFVYDLAEKRKRNNTHKLKTWRSMLDDSKSGLPVASHLLDDGLNWAKKVSIPSNPTLEKFINILKLLKVSAIGSVEMPFCILNKGRRSELAQKLRILYGNSISDSFAQWLVEGDKDLVLVFIAGFKPRGDDSRPDRGLVPLARMIFANDNIDVLSVVYGPAKPRTWEKLFSDPYWLAANNGLWEAVINLSNAVLVDSKTLTATHVQRDVVLEQRVAKVEDTKLKRFSNVPRFGEHDVDSVLHLIFSGSEDEGVFEALCNPPGGDWSGVSFLDTNGTNNRWTSLPRVTGIDGKRPDHILQFFEKNKVMLSVESKDLLRNLEENVGPRLNHYTKELLADGAAQSRRLKDTLEWSQEVNVSLLKKAVSDYDFLSAIAIMGSKADVATSLRKSGANAAFVLNFNSDDTTDLYFSCTHPELTKLLIEYLGSQKNKLQLLKIKLHLQT